MGVFFSTCFTALVCAENSPILRTLCPFQSVDILMISLDHIGSLFSHHIPGLQIRSDYEYEFFSYFIYENKGEKRELLRM